MPTPSTVIRTLVFCSAILGTLAAPAAAQGSGPTIISLNGDIWDGNGGPFLTGNVYHIFSGPGSCCGRVPAGQTLTVQPGAIVKIDFSLNVQGTMIANGATFTSWSDDAQGGDSNGDGGMTLPQPGDWDSLQFTSTSMGSVLNNCLVRYGGGTEPMVWCRGADVAIASCDIFDSASIGVEAGGTLSTVDDCDFNNNLGIPLDGVRPTALPGVTNIRGLNNAVGDYVRVETISSEPWSAPVTWGLNNTMNQTGLVVLRAENAAGTPILTIPTGNALTLDAGLTVKMVGRSWITARGSLITNGTAQDPIVITSIHDDSVGGDTEKDGNATSPAPGDWRQVQWAPGSDASRMSHTELRYGGNGTESMLFFGGSAALEEVSIRDSGSDGLRVRTFGAGPVQVDGLTVEDCTGLALVNVTWQFLASSRNLRLANNGNSHVTMLPETLQGDTMDLSPDQVPATLLVQDTIRVFNGSRLSLPAGTVLKFAANRSYGFNVSSGSQLVCRGTAERPIVFTGELDDAIGGDINLDGGAAAPAPGEWGNVLLGSTAGSILEHVLLRYPGRNNSAGVTATQGPVELRAVRVEHGGLHGIQADSLGAPLDNCVAWDCGGFGIRANNTPFDIRHATVVGCAGVGIEQINSWPGTVRNSISWNNAGGAFGGVPPGQILFSNGDPLLAGSNGNTNVNPQFVDAGNGDLRLSATSPLLGAGDFATGVAVVVDADENQRLARGTLSNPARPDMGAYERSLWSLEVFSEARPGNVLFAQVQGPGGAYFLVLGLLDGNVPLPGVGILTAGNATAQVITNFIALGGLPIPASVPNNPAFLGLEAAVQGVGFTPQVGFTNRVRRTIY